MRSGRVFLLTLTIVLIAAAGFFIWRLPGFLADRRAHYQEIAESDQQRLIEQEARLRERQQQTDADSVKSVHQRSERIRTLLARERARRQAVARTGEAHSAQAQQEESQLRLEMYGLRALEIANVLESEELDAEQVAAYREELRHIVDAKERIEAELLIGDYVDSEEQLRAAETLSVEDQIKQQAQLEALRKELDAEAEPAATAE